jgi:hypothetical protein
MEFKADVLFAIIITDGHSQLLLQTALRMLETSFKLVVDDGLCSISECRG